MLFELVAGQSLYPNEPIATLLWKVAAGDYAPLEPRLTHVDSDLVELIKKALAVEAADRFRSAREMERALDHFRAARGMRMSSRALTQVVSMTWPQIQQMRKERANNEGGELEGARLVLPADQLDWEFDHPGDDPLPKARIEGQEGSAPDEPAVALTTAPRPSSTTGEANALRQPAARAKSVPRQRQESIYPKPNLGANRAGARMPQSQTDLGRLQDQSEVGWAIYALGIVAVAAAAFAWVWTTYGAGS